MSFAKKRLNAEHRLRLINHAASRFQSPKLREAELKARDAVAKAIADAVGAIPKSEIKALAKFGLTSSLQRVYLPHTLIVTTGQREVKEGVSRPIKETVRFTKEVDGKPFCFTRTQGVNEFVRRGIEWTGFGDRARTINFARRLTAPGRAETTALTLGYTDFKVEGTAQYWITDTIYDTSYAYAAAHKARMDAEVKLWSTAFTMILTATTFGDVLSVWPEATAIENDLFGVKPLTNTALVALNQEDLAALCANMQERGVKGGSACSSSAA